MLESDARSLPPQSARVTSNGRRTSSVARCGFLFCVKFSSSFGLKCLRMSVGSSGAVSSRLAGPGWN